MIGSLTDFGLADTVEGEVRWLRRAVGDAPHWIHTVPGLTLPGCPGLGLVRLDGTWRVTHQASGLLLAQLVDLDHARRAATALVALCPGWDRTEEVILADEDARGAWVRVRELIAGVEL